MKYLLDTNICIELIRYQTPAILKHLVQKPITRVFISAITLSELEYGVEKSAHPARNKIALVEFMGSLEVLPYDDMVAGHYGKIRTYLEKHGTPIGHLDMLIAAHALAIKAVLVTNNEKEFKRVPLLKVENWTK